MLGIVLVHKDGIRRPSDPSLRNKLKMNMGETDAEAEWSARAIRPLPKRLQRCKSTGLQYIDRERWIEALVMGGQAFEVTSS